MADLGPTIHRRRLGLAVRRLRERAGMSEKQTAYEIGTSQPRMSKIERGRASIGLAEILVLLDRFHITDRDQRAQLIAMAKLADGRGPAWLASYHDILTPNSLAYFGLESEARRLRTYRPHLVPDLLHTEDYAQALLEAGLVPDRPPERDRMARLRMARQQIVTRSHDPAELAVVLDEAVLHRPIGGMAVLADQLRHIAKFSESPNILVQVIPFAGGPHIALGIPFTLMEFGDTPEQADVDVAFLDTVDGYLLRDRTRDVRRIAAIFGHIRSGALSPEDSRSFLIRAADHLEAGTPIAAALTVSERS